MKERGKLRGDPNDLAATILAKTRSELLNGRNSGLEVRNDGVISLETELSKAAWIRPVCNS
jgi:hypothetical protein